MLIKHLRKAINIKEYISEQEAKIEATNKKDIDRKKRLLKMWKVLKRTYEEVSHFHLKCVGYILKRTVLKEELRKLSELVS